MYWSSTNLSIMKKPLTATLLVIGSFGLAATPFALVKARADPVIFAPDWPNHEVQTEHTICPALAQGWSRAQIVTAAEHAQNFDITGLSVVEAAQRADSLIDAARYAYCPTLNAN